jgi:putative DNA primase/helicase
MRIVKRQREIEAVHTAIFGENGKQSQQNNHKEERQSAVDLSDNELLKRARKARDGAKFMALYDAGDYAGFPSRSEAHLSLCSLLAFWTGRDATRIDHLFRQSALYDERWDRLDYCERTIAAAIENCDNVYQPAESTTWNELAVVDRLAAAHQQDLAWTTGFFFLWDGRRFARDETEQVPKLAEGTVRRIYGEAGEKLQWAAEVKSKDEGKALEHEAGQLLKLAREMSSQGHIAGALRIMRGRVAVSPDQLDAVPHLLNVRNGTIDLRTGVLRPHSHGDLISKLIDINYMPGAAASRWEQFLQEIFAEDDALCRYIQTSVGYSFTGEQREKAFWFGWGPPDSGKTTFFSVLYAVGGDCAQVVPKSLFLKDRDRIPSDVARLHGVRFAYASETAKGRSFDSEKLKVLTGDEPKLIARYMYKELFEFRPAHHLWLASNYKPRASADDDALWKRLRLIPFTVIFTDPSVDNPEPNHLKDRQLVDTLLAEREGILAWVVNGAREYYEHGLNEPEPVTEAGKDYRSGEDTLAHFIVQCVERIKNEWTKQSDMYRAYSHFMQGEKRIMGKQEFNTALEKQHDFKRNHSREGEVWLNVKLREGALPV